MTSQERRLGLETWRRRRGWPQFPGNLIGSRCIHSALTIIGLHSLVAGLMFSLGAFPNLR